MRFLIRLLINAVALGAAEYLLDGISYQGNLAWLIVVALIFGAVNAIIAPLVKLLTCPLILLTLGLFTLVVNALMLQLTAWVAGWLDIGFKVDNFVAAFLGALIVSIISFLLSVFIPEPSED